MSYCIISVNPPFTTEMSVKDSLATNNKSPEMESAEAWIKLPIQILILT